MKPVVSPICGAALRLPAVFVALIACHAGNIWAQQASTLQAITVTGESYTEYKPEHTRSATRTDTPIKEVPQSVSVIPKEVLEDMGESGILSALELGGVGRGNVYAGSVATYTLRGFRSGTYYRNGMAANVGYGAIPDASGVESLDVMRGPSSLTFGAGDPGGAFNVVSKSPQKKAAYTVGLSADEHGGRRGTADLTGALNESKTWLYRLNVAASGGNTWRDHVGNRKQYVAPRLSWQLASQTKLMLDVDWIKGESAFYRGIPISPNLLYGPPARSFYHGDPNAGRVRNKNTTGQLRLEHVFSDDWQMDAGLQRIVGGIDGYGLEVNGLQADRRTYRRRLTRRENRWNGNLAQSYLRGKFNLGAMEHRILAGMEYSQAWSRTRHSSISNATVPTIDAYNPVYGVSLPFHSINEINRPGTSSHTRALVLQDQIRITPALNVLAGLRHERYDQRTTTLYKNNVITPTLGASYALTDALSGYVSYSRSFKPNNSQDAQGNTFDPERGTSWEAGLKADLFDQRLLMTAAVFRTIKTNVVTSHPTLPDVNVLSGEQRSEGMDMSASGKIGAHTRMIAYASLIDAKVTKDNNAGMPPGTRLKDVPKRRMSLTVLHELGGAWQGTEVGTSLQYVGERPTATNNTTLSMPSYSTVNLMLNRQINPQMKFRFALKNLFDRWYYEDSGNSREVVVPGEPRAIHAALEYKF